jgi:hypothetical protein
VLRTFPLVLNHKTLIRVGLNSSFKKKINLTFDTLFLFLKKENKKKELLPVMWGPLAKRIQHNTK